MTAAQKSKERSCAAAYGPSGPWPAAAGRGADVGVAAVGGAARSDTSLYIIRKARRREEGKEMVKRKKKLEEILQPRSRHMRRTDANSRAMDCTIWGEGLVTE